MATRGMRSMVAHAPSKASDSAAWQEDAACVRWDFKKHGDPFFPTSAAPAAAQQAQAICGTCRVRQICGFFAHEDANTFKYGIYGGTTAEDRIRARRRTQQEARRAREETS
ncbi:WhiB family transcriptional regulator [Glutamicibacter sp.]|uniref:WhiB family transcriptional regulator n=1 Tax=Glutamicibacter sp. TaxID=1931995 RepID=UPI0028BE604A|nr:WhiB family transcriptional regulator [Glutamicibacter sp.]